MRKKSWEKPSFTHGTSKKDKTALDKLVFKCSCQGCEHDYKILDSDVNKVRSDDELHFVTGNVIFYCSKCLDVKHIELDEMN